MTMKVNWNRRRYTAEQFTTAWNDSHSVAEVLRKLGMNIYGSAHAGALAAAEELGLTRDHMKGQGWNTGDTGGFVPVPARPLSEVLVYGKRENNDFLKKRLIRHGIKQHKCEDCGNTEWMGRPIPIALDHEDGDRLNNRIENLRILCYNCHGLTATYCQKKK